MSLKGLGHPFYALRQNYDSLMQNKFKKFTWLRLLIQTPNVPFLNIYI